MLEQILRDLLHDGNHYDPVLANAVKTAQQYQNATAETDSLVTFFSTLR
jgi:hypothetical protein